MIARIKSSFLYFGSHFALGVRYALYFLVVAAVMGFIYGALGAIWIAPAFVAISYLGIYVIINFVFAFLFALINLFPATFNKGSKRLSRYFAYSFAFLIVFLLYFAILKYSGFEPF